jgi:hypothetical protein
VVVSNVVRIITNMHMMRRAGSSMKRCMARLLTRSFSRRWIITMGITSTSNRQRRSEGSTMVTNRLIKGNGVQCPARLLSKMFTKKKLTEGGTDSTNSRQWGKSGKREISTRSKSCSKIWIITRSTYSTSSVTGFLNGGSNKKKVSKRGTTITISWVTFSGMGKNGFIANSLRTRILWAIGGCQRPRRKPVNW